MPKRGENIRKRKDGRWEGRYIYKRTDCGKALYRSVYAHSYSDVKKLLEKARHDSYAISAQSESKTFNEAAMLWLSVYELSHKYSTVVKYTEQLNKHILPQLGCEQMALINDEKITGFLKDKATVLSDSSMHTLLTIIKAIVKYSVEQGIIVGKITDLRLSPRGKKEVEALTYFEQTQLQNYLLKNMDEINLGLYLCLFTGLRVGELCAVRWSDIDLHEKTMHI